MKTIAIIPARGGSKRLAGKNTRLLGGLPLLAHSIRYAKANAAIIDAVYVSTDDHLIAETAQAFGASVIARPAALSGDLEPTVSALRHVLENLPDTVENVVLLQPTNPLRPENLLRDAFEIYNNGDYDSLFTVTRNEQKFGRIIGNRFAPFNYIIGQRSQDLEPLYFENGMLYLSKAVLIKENTIIGKNHFPMITDHIYAGVDIDTIEDFEYAQYLYAKMTNKE